MAKLAAIQAVPFPAWSADGEQSLSQFIKEFAVRGVDTSAAEALSEEYANFVAGEKEKAAREAERAPRGGRRRAQRRNRATGCGSPG